MTVEPKNGRAFKLEELRQHVGVGELEWLYLKNGVAIFDENSRIRVPGAEYNESASDYVNLNVRRKSGYVLLGDVLIADMEHMG